MRSFTKRSTYDGQSARPLLCPLDTTRRRCPREFNSWASRTMAFPAPLHINGLTTIIRIIAGLHEQSSCRGTRCALIAPLMPVDRLQIMLSRSGLPTVQADGVVYHSIYSPVREAEQFYEHLKLEEA